MRRWAWSIQFSRRLAVATSPNHRTGHVREAFHYESLIVFANLTQRVPGIDKLGVILGDSLQWGYVPDGTDRRSTNLAHTPSDIVCHSQDLVRVLVQQQVVVAKMRSNHVPVEVCGLEIKREHVG